LVRGFGLAASLFAGLSRDEGSFFAGASLGGSFFAGLSLEGSFFAAPLPGGVRGTCDGLFFVAGAGSVGLGSSPRPKRRCKKWKKPSFSSLMVSQR
jgi:hypothetical protein